MYGSPVICTGCIMLIIIILYWLDPHTYSIVSTSFKACHPKSYFIPPRDKDEIGTLLEKKGYKYGLEIGVFDGRLSERILRKWNSCETYYLVDLWMVRNISFSQKRLAQYNKQTVFLMMSSNDALKKFQNESLDFVYIDTSYDYCSLAQDIKSYWVKLRPGGLMAGHYYDRKGLWKRCGTGPVITNFTLTQAVDEFVMQHNLTLTFAFKSPQDWFILK